MPTSAPRGAGPPVGPSAPPLVPPPVPPLPRRRADAALAAFAARDSEEGERQRADENGGERREGRVKKNLVKMQNPIGARLDSRG